MSYILDFDVTKFLFLFATSLCICSIIYNWIRTRDYPPGPVGLPILGYGPFLGKNPHLTLRDLSKTYGDLFSFYMGPQLIVCVSDYRLAKELLNNPLTLARPPHSFDLILGKGGFSSMHGEAWQEQRRFAIHTMRNLGLGKGLWETMIQDDSAEFVKEMMKSNGQPVFFDTPLSISQVINNLSLLFGRHLDMETDAEDIAVLRNFGKKMLENFSSVGITVTLPWLSKLIQMLNPPSFREFISILRMFDAIFRKEVNRRLLSSDSLEKDDFIGCYLREMEKQKNNEKPSTFTVENLLGNLFSLFSAGQDSTVASVSWLLLLMTKHPEVQKKVCDEIDKVIGRDGVVYYDDKAKMPYTMATILEMQRYIAIAALFAPRYVLDTFTFNGYTIPQGCHVISNNWAMLHDPRYFKEPMKFNPERFLTENGTKIAKIEGYGAFSFGKRNCPGEGVAIMTIYMYFVSIMQKFQIKTPHGIPPDMSYKFAAGLLPKRQQLCLIER